MQLASTGLVHFAGDISLREQMSLIDRAASLLNVASRLSRATVRRGIPYGLHERHRMDIYEPRRSRSKATLVFFYGGGWIKGARGMYEFVGRAFAGAGIRTLIPDYRLRADASLSASIEDGHTALSWIARYERYGRLVVSGHSAGAFIAATLSLTANYRVGVDGLIGLAGPFDYLSATSVTAPTRTLLLSAGRDRLVDPRAADRLAAIIRQAGGSAESLVYPNTTHAGLVGAIASPLRWQGPVFFDMMSFINSAE